MPSCLCVCGAQFSSAETFSLQRWVLPLDRTGQRLDPRATTVHPSLQLVPSVCWNDYCTPLLTLSTQTASGMRQGTRKGAPTHIHHPFQAGVDLAPRAVRRVDKRQRGRKQRPQDVTCRMAGGPGRFEKKTRRSFRPGRVGLTFTWRPRNHPGAHKHPNLGRARTRRIFRQTHPSKGKDL